MTEQEWREEFARAVRVRMRRKCMKQNELAREANINPVTMSRYMTCQRSPRADAIVSIARVLECTTDELIMFADEGEMIILE